MSRNNQKALSAIAGALYGLRRFKECADQFTKIVKLYPSNQEADGDLKRCLARLREEKGHFDFAAMLDEAIAKNPTPEMDRADYVGPIEVRTCAIESHGRGIFCTKPVKAGELLLVEKAFCAKFPPRGDPLGNEDTTTNSPGQSDLSELRAQIAADIFVKMQRNPSLAPAFADLYSGSDAEQDFDIKKIQEIDE